MITPVTFLILISVVVGLAVLISAAYLYGLNGSLTRIISLALFAVAGEIGLAVIADFFIDDRLTFVIIKILGRLIEGGGVIVLLLWIRRKIANSPHPPSTLKGDI